MAQRNPFNLDFASFLEPVSVGSNLELLRNTTTTEVYERPERSNEDDSDDEENEGLCSICQENYENGQIIRKINHCHHFYHQKCLDEWLEGNTKCPECQHDLRDGINRNNRRNSTNENSNNSSTRRSSNTIGPQSESQEDEMFHNLLRELLTSGPLARPNHHNHTHHRTQNINASQNPLNPANPLNSIVQGFLSQIQQDPGEGVINIEYHREGQPPMIMNATSTRDHRRPQVAPRQRHSRLPRPQYNMPQLARQPRRLQSVPPPLPPARPAPQLRNTFPNTLPVIQQQQPQVQPQVQPQQTVNPQADQIARLERELQTLKNSISNQNQTPIQSQHHLISELPQNDFRELDLTNSIFSLRDLENRDRPSRSRKKSNKKNDHKKRKSRWKFWKS